jgi:hypothetical protein
MLKSELPEVKPASEEKPEDEKGKPTPLPDLFTMMKDDEDFGAEEESDTLKESPRESFIPPPYKTQENLSNSQRLENTNDKILSQVIGNQENKIKRIVLFYENGKFESFEP